MSIVTPDASRFVFRAGPYIPPLVPIGRRSGMSIMAT